MAKDAGWRMVRTGLLAMLVSLLAGFGLLFALLGGLSLSPLPVIIEMAIPGSVSGWRVLHLGMMTNGLMAIALGLVLRQVAVAPATAHRIALGTTIAVWGNFAFYLFGMMAPNRGLTLAGNSFGPASLAGALAFVPALIGAFTLLAAVWALMRAAPKE